MYAARDLHGVMAMMPAFATPDAGDINATSTIDVDNLQRGVDRMIKDGINVIATTGSFGEFHTLLPEEYETIIRATIEAVDKRVPLFLGCTALNSRQAVRNMRFIRDAGGQGVLVGVPFYFPSTVDNAVEFYRQIGGMFPDLSIMVYHNPALHHVTIPVDAFNRLVDIPNIVGMKDSHRQTAEMLKLHQIIKGKISQFCFQGQYYPYAQLGAAGCWSIDAWMGPWPLLAIRDAVEDGNTELAAELTMALTGGGTPDGGLSWRETANKIAIHYAGYCEPGPLRPPFVKVPENIVEGAKKRAAYWQTLCDKARPHVKEKVLA